MKKTAWTMAEMIIAIVILAMLSSICAAIFKPNLQKARMYVYSAMRDISGANVGILEKHGTLNQAGSSWTGADDYYCTYLADLFNTSSAADCTKTLAGADTVNIRYPNGLTIQGLASPWVSPYSGATYQFKNFVIDINGSKGPNVVWADRFPLRVIGGTGYAQEGEVVVVNCGSEVVPPNKSVDAAAKNPYCKNGWSANGTAVTTDFTNDNQVVSYDVVRADSDSDGEQIAKVLMSGVSQKLADCSAYGGAEGLNSATVCGAAGMKLLPACANEATCYGCISTNCPTGSTTPDTCKSAVIPASNPNKLDCFVTLHKPSMGAHFIFQAILGNIDEDFN